MSDQQQQNAPDEKQKPGYGVDRTQIRQLLALTPAERLRVMVESSRNMAALLTKIRRIR